MPYVPELETWQIIVTERPITINWSSWGETEEYEPLSRAAYYKAMLKEKVNALEVNSEEITPPQKKSND